METLIQEIQGIERGQFRPRAFYSEEGDSLTFYFKKDESYAERIDNFLTIYKSFANDELVGCQVKGLPAALELLGDFGMDFYEGGKLKLSLLFLAFCADAPDEARNCYKMLGKIAAKENIEITAPTVGLNQQA